LNILLNTCTILWIVADSPDLSAKARQLFADPDNDVCLNATSAKEIIVKHGMGKLSLPGPPHDFIHNWRTRL
jgi:PIN domain nuclease of toxin-antitoxin system